MNYDMLLKKQKQMEEKQKQMEEEQQRLNKQIEETKKRRQKTNNKNIDKLITLLTIYNDEKTMHKFACTSNIDRVLEDYRDIQNYDEIYKLFDDDNFDFNTVLFDNILDILKQQHKEITKLKQIIQQKQPNNIQITQPKEIEKRIYGKGSNNKGKLWTKWEYKKVRKLINTTQNIDDNINDIAIFMGRTPYSIRCVLLKLDLLKKNIAWNI